MRELVSNEKLHRDFADAPQLPTEEKSNCHDSSFNDEDAEK